MDPGSVARGADHHSASVIVVDRFGNVALIGHSSNTPLWGDTGLIVGGIALPTPAGIYQPRLAAIRPGDRLPSDMGPLLLMHDGRPSLALSGIGVSIYFETVRLMLGLSGNGDLAEWAAAPPLLLNVDEFDRAPAERSEYVPAGSYSQAFLDALQAEGLRPHMVDTNRASALRGTVAMVRLGRDGVLSTAETPGVILFGAGR